MKVIIYSVWAVFLISCLALLIFHIKSRKPLRSILKNAAIGILGLVAVNCFSKLTGVHIPINWWSVGLSSAFGIPAVSGLIILQTLFFI